MRPLVGILSSWREPGDIPLPLHATAATYVAAVRSFAGAETVLIPGSEDPDQANSLLPFATGTQMMAEFDDRGQSHSRGEDDSGNRKSTTLSTCK